MLRGAGLIVFAFVDLRPRDFPLAASKKVRWGFPGLVAEKKGREVKPVAGISPRKKRGTPDPESYVANSLRSAYEETVREQIPQEFMDLLGKLS